MTKKEFITKLAEVSELTKKDSETFLNAFTEIVSNAEEDIRLVGFGNFVVKERAARQGINPQNPSEKIEIPASKTIGFKPSKKLKREL